MIRASAITIALALVGCTREPNPTPSKPVIEPKPAVVPMIDAAVAIVDAAPDAPALAPVATDGPAPSWDRVVAAAAELVPAVGKPLLDSSGDKELQADPTDARIDEVVAWAAAKGGLAWRGVHAIEKLSGRPLAVYKIGKAALAKRATDPKAIAAALYLGKRLRAEGGCTLDVLLGFGLFDEAKELAPAATKALPDLAPTEPELRRAVALNAVCGRSLIVDHGGDLKKDEALFAGGKVGTKAMQKSALAHHPAAELREKALRAFAQLVTEAPADRHLLGAHVANVIASYDEWWLVGATVGSGMIKQLDTVNSTLDHLAL